MNRDMDKLFGIAGFIIGIAFILEGIRKIRESKYFLYEHVQQHEKHLGCILLLSGAMLLGITIWGLFIIFYV